MLIQQQQRYIIAPKIIQYLLLFLTNFFSLTLLAQKGKIVIWPDGLEIVDANDSSKLLAAIDVMPNVGIGTFVRFVDTIYVVDYAPIYGTDAGAHKDTSPINLYKFDISKNTFNRLESVSVQEPSRKMFQSVSLRVDSLGYTLTYKNWDKNLTLEKKFKHKELMNFKAIYAEFRRQALLLMD